MGFRFRRGIGLGPFRVNLSRRGAGVSIGVPGARVTSSATGQKYVTLGIPGTGISWTKTIGSRRSRTNVHNGITGRSLDEPSIGDITSLTTTTEDGRSLAPLEFD